MARRRAGPHRGADAGRLKVLPPSTPHPRKSGIEDRRCGALRNSPGEVKHYTGRPSRPSRASGVTAASCRLFPGNNAPGKRLPLRGKGIPFGHSGYCPAGPERYRPAGDLGSVPLSQRCLGLSRDPDLSIIGHQADSEVYTGPSWPLPTSWRSARRTGVPRH